MIDEPEWTATYCVNGHELINESSSYAITGFVIKVDFYNKIFLDTIFPFLNFR